MLVSLDIHVAIPFVWFCFSFDFFCGCDGGRRRGVLLLCVVLWSRRRHEASSPALTPHTRSHSFAEGQASSLHSAIIIVNVHRHRHRPVRVCPSLAHRCTVRNPPSHFALCLSSTSSLPFSALLSSHSLFTPERQFCHPNQSPIINQLCRLSLLESSLPIAKTKSTQIRHNERYLFVIFDFDST